MAMHAYLKISLVGYKCAGSGTNALAVGIAFLTNAQAMTDAAIKAEQFVRDAIAVVKAAPDNPYGDDDEAIAGELMRRIDERNREQLRAHARKAATP